MRLVRIQESISDFHAREIPQGLGEAELWLFEPSTRGLVLGSAQNESAADLDAATSVGVQVVRRRSGGGAVYVDPYRCLWIDVVIPRDDERWTDDVRRSTDWLGNAWKAALANIGTKADLYEGGLEQTPWGRLVCFAALGPGELLVDGRKAIGISQRRTRTGARFQCIVYDRWDPWDVLDLLALPDEERHQAATDLSSRAVGVGPHLDALRSAIISELIHE